MMDYGALSAYFDGAAAKTLTEVDVNPKRSNQHELNGIGALRSLFGDDDIKNMPTTFAYLDDEDEPVFDHGVTTWYDSRRKHPTRTEYRLYYTKNPCIAIARPGDLVVVALSAAREVLVIFAAARSTVASQLRWLFGLSETGESSFALSSVDSVHIDSMAAQILEAIGIKVRIPTTAERYLDGLIEQFGGCFPKGADFSAYSASTLGELDWAGDPDGSLIACYEREELLFRLLERHILEDELAPYFGTAFDVDGILRITMSAFQRRKSRAGAAFENQLSLLFDARGIRYSAQKYTEGKSKPDFIFPSIEDYHNPAFPAVRLTMLGAKTTIKERWRQVLSEANRVEGKHLVTLEPAVSADYTNAMKEVSLQLVVPRPLFATYDLMQREWLMDIASFCELVEARQQN